MPIMPDGFNGAIFARKFNVTEFWAVGNNLICPPLPELTDADIADCVDLTTPIIIAVQLHLDATAQAHGYNDMLACVSYATSLIPAWAAEGQDAAAWRDDCWQRTFDIINAGAPYPTPAEVVALLPPMVWP